MKFYMTPGSCSTGTHILLEEAGVIFEAYLVNLLAGEQYRREYLALNPRGSVPTLVCDDGRVLTDFSAIAWWIGESFPRRKLLPESARERVTIERLMEYAVTVVHGEGFTRVFVADRYAAEAKERRGVVEEGRAIVTKGLRRLASMYTGDPYVLPRFSIADAAAFYVEFWADHVGIAMPPACERHYMAMLSRPAVRQVLAEEGYAATLRRRTPAAPARVS